jgi:phosphate acetyltransferase
MTDLPRPHLDRIVRQASAGGAMAAAVAYPCSANALAAALMAQQQGLIDPVLVGPAARIAALAAASGLDLGNIPIVETGEDPLAAARGAVALCNNGRAQLIVKGSLHTDELLGAVVSRESQLRTNRRVSHTFVFDIPGEPKPLLMADCVVNINPGLWDKRDIVQNAIDLCHALGTVRPYAAVLSPVETVNPAIAGTLDAAALSKMAQRGQITGGDVEGPLSFDLAMAPESARIKGIVLPVAGVPDILIVPNLETGNPLYKQLVHFGHADCAGIVLGTRVPIVLTSRADSIASRVASCALAVLRARA